MNWTLFLQLAIAATIPLVGIGISHWLTSKRDYENERRKLRIQYLVDAYRRLEDASNRPNTEAVWAKFESALADIQLFGSARQVELARKFVAEMAASGTSPLNDLIFDLRDSLRVELALEPVEKGVLYLRFKDGPRSRNSPFS